MAVAPVVAVLVAVKVSTLVVVVLVGLKAAVTPDGWPEADKATVPVKAFWGITVIVVVTLPPWMRLGFGGVAESVKDGGGGGGVLLPPHPARADIEIAVKNLHHTRQRVVIDRSRSISLPAESARRQLKL
jgi:hypothetical protein